MNRLLADIRRMWNEFFFTPETPYALALIRILMPIFVLTMMVTRWPAARELYSADGATAPIGLGYGYPHFLPEFSGPVVVALASLLVLSLITTLIGWQTRASLLVGVTIFTYFCMLDAISTMTKYTVIMTHVLLLLSVSHCGAIWSVDAWLARRRQPAGLPALPPTFPAWPRRCLQLLIGVIYFGAAVTKMNTPTFLSGDQLMFWMLTHINFRHPIGEFFALYPVLLKAMGYVTIVWEMTFVFLVWKGVLRPWVLAVGVLFHTMTVLTLGLVIFPLVCFTTYLSFLDERDFHQVRDWCRRQLRASPRLTAAWSALYTRGQRGAPLGWQSASGLAFAGTALAVMLLGVEAEHWLDPYGVRRPAGRHQLKVVDPALAQRMLAPTPPLRDEDKFFSVDTGTFLVGDLLADRRRVYRPGETMIVQCNLTPPHADMAVVCLLRDADNRLVDRTTNIATREQFRTNFVFSVTEAFPPGDYTVVVQTAGVDVMHKRIQIAGGSLPAAH